MMMAESQTDPQAAEALSRYISEQRNALRTLFHRAAQRDEVAADADTDLLIDQALGFVRYRLLLNPVSSAKTSQRILRTGSPDKPRAFGGEV